MLLYRTIRRTNSLVPNGFDILRNSNTNGSSVEVNIDNIYECYSYREIFYFESEKMVKMVYYDHVIPGLDESIVNSPKGLSIEKRPYVEENKVKSGRDGQFPFTTGIEIDYLGVSDCEIQFE